MEAARDVLTDSIERWAKRHLEPLLAPIGLASVRPTPTVTKQEKHGGAYTVRLCMALPRRKILVARATAADLNAALHEALERLLVSVRRHLERLRRQESYKREARRQRLRELKLRIAELPEETVTQARTGVESVLPRVESVVARELDYLRSIGELPADYPTLSDIVDEAVAAVTADWRPDTTGERLTARLLREAFRTLDREIAASRQYGVTVSLESAPPRDPREQAEAMVQEEFYEFRQPDEALHLADLLPDEAVATPEAELAEQERLYAERTIAQLPLAWRRALMLRRTEGFSPQEIASILDSSPAQVTVWIEQAESFVAAHLAQAGFTGPDIAQHTGQP